MTQNDTITAWAEFVLKVWSERMSSLGISNASQHANSLAFTIVSAAGGDVAKVDFMFEYILKFTDMGVGKGVSVAGRMQSNTIRQKKQWFTKSFLLEVKKLAGIMAAYYGHQGTLYVKEAWESNPTNN